MASKCKYHNLVYGPQTIDSNLQIYKRKTQDSTVNSSRQDDHVLEFIDAKTPQGQRNGLFKQQIDCNMWITGGLHRELEDFFMFTGNCVDVDPKDIEHIESKIESIANMVINVKELIDETEHKILNDRENITYPLGQ